ncbi:uncharacterized protein LOC142777036 [Rhipicephalus microplus]|uniref:uncharacterized protein LOC142777036 n=1 Tax=Rhipicephalus microplus TaxID=6941 RepID=UPI003F6B99F1
MGRCCVPNCRGNYDGGPKVRLFSFPKDDRRIKWKRAIRREDVDIDTLRDSKVCELHFKAEYLRTTTTYTDSNGKTIEVSRYCLEELGFEYVLLAKFQTDSLEERFGRYRRLCGSNYHISVQQIFESEAKLRLQNSLVFPDMKELSQPSSIVFDAAKVIEEYGIKLTEEDIKSKKGKLACNSVYCRLLRPRHSQENSL